MKKFLVLLLIAASMGILVILLDLAMDFQLKNILWEEIRPFKVTQQTTIVILLMFFIYFMGKALVHFFKKRQQKSTSQNGQK